MPIKTGLLILCLSSCCVWLSTAHSETIVEQSSRQQTVTLNVQNMTCAMCTITIKKALQQVDGVQQVTVDYDTKTATIIFDTTKTNSADLIKATTDAGYPATLSTPGSQ